MKALPSERGQAMVLIVFAIIGLFGMAALAVDMGQVYAARRNAQNAADAAALAAAYAASTGTLTDAEIEQSAFDMAKSNGYDNNYTTNWVVYRNPPVDGAYCETCEGIRDPTEYYQVKVTVLLQPIFAQLVFNGIEKVTVEAVAHVTTADDISAGNALMSLSKSEDSMVFDGKTGVEVNGGNIRANGRLTKNGCSGGITSDAKVYYGEDSGDGYKGGSDGTNSCTTIVSPVPEYSPAVSVSGFKEPACPKSTDIDGTWKDEGGYYSKPTGYGSTTYYYQTGLPAARRGVTVVPPGIYCIEAERNKPAIGNGNFQGKGVLFVLINGDIQQNGEGDSIDFQAASDIKDANGNQYGGLVFYVPPTNKAPNGKNVTLTFGGNTSAYLYGTFFAPGSTCDVGGNADETAIHSAIICDTVKVHGNPVVKIEFAPEQLFHFPPRVEMVQ